MKPLLKTCLLTAAVSTAYFASNAAHAANNKLLTAASELSYQQVNEELPKGNLLLQSSYYLTLETRILDAKDKSEHIVHSNCNAKKKNELYELSAIFNDKLQLFLAYFNDRPTYTAARKNREDSLAANRSTQL